MKIKIKSREYNGIRVGDWVVSIDNKAWLINNAAYKVVGIKKDGSVILNVSGSVLNNQEWHTSRLRAVPYGSKDYIYNK